MPATRFETDGHPIVAAIYDLSMYPPELLGFRRQRQRMMREATGRVLELAAGTELNFPFYTRAREVVAIDPDPFMLSAPAGARQRRPAR